MSDSKFSAHRTRIAVTGVDTSVSSLSIVPDNAEALFVLAHGAGADMHHPFMETLAKLLAARRIATLRYQFPYTEQGRKRPDQAKRLIATVRSVVAHAGERYQDLPLYAGGKSLGGRMTSHAAAEVPLPRTAGLVFLGFPLHAPGKPDDTRGAHLSEVTLPMLFLQGNKDRLADLELLKPLCRRLGDFATLHVVDGADHSFHVPKKTGRTDIEVLDELAEVIKNWIHRR